MSLTIAAALTRLKNTKSKLAQIEKLIDSSVRYYEDEKPEFEYLELQKERSSLLASILTLKVKIQHANVATEVVYDGNTISLAALILVNSDIRSELAYWSGLFNKGNGEYDRYSKRSTEDVKQTFADGYDRVKIRNTIADYEKRKEEVEEIMTSANFGATIPE